MARSKYGDPLGFLLHCWQRHMPGNIRARSGWTGRATTFSIPLNSKLVVLLA